MTSEWRMRLERWACLAPAVSAVIVYTAFVVRNAVNTVYWDNWASVPLLHAFDDGRLRFSEVWEQAANNRVVVPRALDLALGRWFRYDVRVELVAAVVLLAIAVVLLMLTQRRNNGGPLHLYAPVALFLFSIVQWQTALWNTQMPRFLILALFALAAFAVCRSSSWWSLALASLAAMVASLSLLDGFLLWPAIALLMWCDGGPRRAWRLSIWALLGGVTSIVYFVGFDFGEGNTGDLGHSITHPIASVRFLLVLLGGFSRATPAQPGLAEACGILMVGLSVWVLVRFWRSDRGLAEALPVALVMFVLLFDLSTLAGRGLGDPGYGLQSRYTTYNLLLFVAAYFALVNRRAWRVSDEWKAPILGAIGGVGAAVTIMLVTVSLTTARHEGAAFAGHLRTSAEVLRNYRSVPVSQIEQYVCPAICLDLVLREAPFLEEQGYSVFAE